MMIFILVVIAQSRRQEKELRNPIKVTVGTHIANDVLNPSTSPQTPAGTAINIAEKVRIEIFKRMQNDN